MSLSCRFLFLNVFFNRVHEGIVNYCNIGEYMFYILGLCDTCDVFFVCWGGGGWVLGVV